MQRSNCSAQKAHLSAAVFPPTNYPTYSFLTVNPNPIGIGQRLSVNFWLDKPTPNAAGPAGDRWQGITVTITKPNGQTEIKGPFKFDAVGSGWTDFYPKDAGKYTFQMKFPGQWVNYSQGSNTYQNYYQPSEGAIVELTVQQDPVAYWKDIPLPTGYWTRPLNAELRGTSDIASYWLAAGATGPHGPRAANWFGNYQPYGAAPNSAHVLWTRPQWLGGEMGGAVGGLGTAGNDREFYHGQSYESYSSPSICVDGKLFYSVNQPPRFGWYCVDLYSGKTLYWQNYTSTGGRPTMPSMGQTLNIDNPNQHGGFSYLWRTSGVVLEDPNSTSTTTWTRRTCG